MGTAFTYQGRLMDEGQPASGLYDLQFSLYDASAGGTQLGTTASLAGVDVSDGRFTVKLDFGATVFGAGARWIEIEVRAAGGGGYTLLSPRQELTPAPYALGMPNVYTNEANGFVGIGRSGQITFNEKFGVRAQAGVNSYGGMYVETSDPAGWPFIGFATGGAYHAWTYYTTTNVDSYHLTGWHLYAGGNRLTVPSSGGLRIGSTANDGIQVVQTGDDALQVGSDTYGYPNYGVYVPSPGLPYICLLVFTANASGDYALYTTDNIAAGNLLAGAQSLIASVTDPDGLEVGDVVVAEGLDDPLPGGVQGLVQVRRAEGATAGFAGVVANRLILAAAPGKEAEGEMVLQVAEGPARIGDYVALVVLGVADVRVAPGASIAKGERVTAADGGGAVRPLRTALLNGMVVSEGAPTVGTALASSTGGGTVPVFVSLR